MKLLITENQYYRLFSQDILLEQTWTDKGSNKIRSKVAPGPISYGVNPNNTFNYCRPKGRIVSGYAGSDWNWCKATQWGDSYMGAVTYQYKGQKVTVDTKVTGRYSGYYQGYELENGMGGLFNEIKGVNRYIQEYNEIYGLWNILSVKGQWSGKVIHLSPESVKILGGNGLEKLFTQHTPPNAYGIGVNNTNLFYAQPIIEEIYRLSNQVDKNVMSILNKEIFKKEQQDLQKKWKQKVKKWESDLKKWEEIWGIQYNEIMDIIRNTEFSKKSQANLKYYEENAWRDQDSNDPSKYHHPKDYIFLQNDYSDPQNDVEDTWVNYDEIIYELKSQIGNINLPQKLTKKEDIQKFQDWLDKKYPTWANGKSLNKRIPGYGLFGPQTSKAWKLYGPLYYYNLKGKIKPPPVYPPQPKLRDLTERLPNEISDLEKLISFYENLVDAATQHNLRFNKQSRLKYREWCNKPVSSSASPSWYTACEKNGGVWWYKGGKNRGTCGCVSNPDMEYQGSKNNIFYSYNLAASVEYKVQNQETRGGWEIAGDWVYDCVTDWHCVADVASIAVLFIPVPGLNVALSAAIDIVSATGYVIEQDPGWKLNAGLTLVGALFSGAEFSKYSKAALKGELQASKWVKALNKTVETSSKMDAAALKGLTKEEASELWLKSFKKVAEEMGTAELKELDKVLKIFQKMDKTAIDDLGKMIDGLGKLSKAEKSQFEVLMNSFAKSQKKLLKFATKIVENGYDIKKVLKSYSNFHLTKDAFIQSTLFGLMQGYSTEIGEGILKSVETVKDSLGVPLDKWLGLTLDKNVNDANSLKIKEKIEDLQTYFYEFTHLRLILKSDMYRQVLEKYGINTNKDIKSIVFNGIDSIMGDPAKTTIEFLDDFTRLEKTLQKEGKSETEIKEILQNKYDEIIKFLEDASKEENILHLIKKEADKQENKITPEQQEIINDFNWDNTDVLSL